MRGLRFCVVGVASVLAPVCFAEDLSWSVTLLDPQTQAMSIAYAIDGDKQFGVAFRLGANLGGACSWQGSAATLAMLHPSFADASIINAAYGGYQGGRMTVLGVRHAALWHGTAASVIDLDPGFGTESEVTAISADGQVGNVRVGNRTHAVLWRGSAGDYVDLTPPGQFSYAYCFGASDGMQVGVSDGSACIWRSTLASMVKLAAGLPSSTAFATDGATQVGDIVQNNEGVACLWRGTPESLTILAPAGSTRSRCLAVQSQYQVGYADFNGRQHAGIWAGSKESFIDLHQYLPSRYATSSANAISYRASRLSLHTYKFSIIVAGFARPDLNPLSSDGTEAVLWKLEGTTGEEPSGRTRVRIITRPHIVKKFPIDLHPKMKPQIPRWKGSIKPKGLGGR